MRSKSELPKYSAYITKEYYKNNIQPFLNSFSEKCLWIGPAQGQMIRTRKKLIEAFSQENNQLTFKVQNLQTIPIAAGASALDVLLHYTIITYYPNGETIVFQQRNELLWVEETVKDDEDRPVKEYFIRVCHISNEYPYDETVKTKMSKFTLKGIYGSFFYLSGDTIMWIESKRPHSLIHTRNKVYECLETVTAVAEKYPDVLLKIHTSYAVNPVYVSEIGRFYVKLQDGKRLSIPEKRYTQIRDELNRRMKLLNK